MAKSSLVVEIFVNPDEGVNCLAIVIMPGRPFFMTQDDKKYAAHLHEQHPGVIKNIKAGFVIPSCHHHPFYHPFLYLKNCR